MTNKVKVSNLGYPRIGKNREWKKSLEAYWQGKINEEQFRSEMAAIQLQHLKTQQEAGIELIPVNDFTFMTMCWIRLLCLELYLHGTRMMAATSGLIFILQWPVVMLRLLPVR